MRIKRNEADVGASAPITKPQEITTKSVTIQQAYGGGEKVVNCVAGVRQILCTYRDGSGGHPSCL